LRYRGASFVVLPAGPKLTLILIILLFVQERVFVFVFQKAALMSRIGCLCCTCGVMMASDNCWYLVPLTFLLCHSMTGGWFSWVD